MTTPETHRKQINDKIAESLVLAGIGRAYHQRTLSDVSGGVVLQALIADGTARSEVQEGRGWNIIGLHSTAYDAAILLARGLHLSGLKARVASLTRLLNQIKEGGDLLPEYADCSVLMVTNFYQTYPGNPVPLEGYEVRAVETFLQERLDDRRAVFVHSAKPLAESVWWSPVLLGRLSGLNRTLVVA